MQVTGRIIAALLLLPVVLLIVVRVLGLDLGHPWAAVLTVFPWVVLLGLVGTGIAAVARWWPVVGVGGVALVAALAVIVPRVLDGPAPAEPADGPELTVAVANLREGNGDADTVVAAVEEHEVDLLVTLELTEPAIERLAAAGLDDLLPQVELQPSRFTSGGGIHSRFPLTAREPDEARGFGRTPRASIEVPDAGTVLLDAVHPLPPIVPDWTAQWRGALAALPDAAPDDERRLLLGDFNATLDHAPLRNLLARGWVDAADAVGAGLVPTFSAMAYGEPVPPVTIDHVLVDRRTTVRAVRTVSLPGSDHRMLVVDLRLPAG